MSHRFRRWTGVAAALALVVTAIVAVALPARAQEGDTVLAPNDPVIITLPGGESVSRTFSVLAGDSFELRLSPVGVQSYSAVLLDPSQATTPLTPDAAGNVVLVVDPAPVAGNYTLVMQADAPGGDLLVLLVSDATPPESLAAGGLGSADVSIEGARYLLEAPPDQGPMTLSLQAVFPADAPGTGLPGLTLTDPETGEVVLQVAPGLLPGLTLSLPAGKSYILALDASETPMSVEVAYEEAFPPVEESSDESSSDSSSDSDTSSDGSSDSSSESTSPSATPVESVDSGCQVVFSGPVNVRGGPGIAYNPPLGTAQAGSTYPVTGINAEGTWVQINYNGVLGWVSLQIAATTLDGTCSSLPIASAPAPGESSQPAATSTPVATNTPGPSPTPTATSTTGPSPTPTYTYTPLPTVTPGGPTVTYTPTASNTPPQPTATYTPSYTPTQQQPPTATYTPSYTPTTPPAAQVAPEDARFNNPLTIPLDNTASVLDFVSYPGGDREDRVRWDITGMNSNSALSGGRARLVISVSCFGENTDQIQFFTGGQTFFCGQTIVDREVTFNSKTGSVIITAVGGQGTYVQWVLTGTATRIN